MYKAIIADDENKICQLILAMGRWEDLGICVVDICHSGDDTWESIQKNKPDIVLIDIRMPVLDGLQIINKYNETYGVDGRNICFIIISGYAEFEYARQAIQYNIVNYLLKPLDKDQLNEALQKACNSLEAKQKQEENAQRLEENRKALQAECVQSFRKVKGIGTMGEINQRYCTEFQQGWYRGLFLNFPFSISNQENLFLKIFTDKLDEYFGTCLEKILEVEGTGIYVLLNYSGGRGNVRETIRDFYKSIGELSKTYGEFQVYLGVGSEKDDIQKAGTTLEEAENAELSRILHEGKDLIFYEDLEMDKDSLYQVISLQSFRKLEQVVEKLSTFEIKNWFSQATMTFEKSRNRLHTGVILTDARKVIFGIIRKTLIEMDGDLVEQTLEETERALKQAQNLSNYFWIIKSKTVFLVEQLTELISQREIHPVQAAKQYIQQNYGKTITLSEVAEKLNFSSVYFGNMFKKHTGKTFNAYLTDVRMEQAKQLLKRQEYTISEIAGMVGYQDIKYFSKTFKNIYGVKPSEYKKLLSSLHIKDLHI